MTDAPSPDPHSLPDTRTLLTRFLLGSGIELGPGHHPLPLPFGGASVRYVDRWEPDQNRELFPELGAAPFPKPDIVANLNTDRLSMISDSSQDFVIASHVLEHLAEPVGQLADVYRVLRPGGTFLVLLPDRRKTFDIKRSPTALEHLLAEHRENVTSVSDDHIEDFLRNTGTWDDNWSEIDRRNILELHRNRSVHAHCWSQDEFPAVVEYTIREMGMRWELLDALFVEDAERGIEFGFVLRRSTRESTPDAMAEHLRGTWAVLAARAAAGARLRNFLVYRAFRKLWRAQRKLRGKSGR